MDEEESRKLSRRDLIKTIGLTTGAVVATGGIMRAIQPTNSSAESPHDKIEALEASIASIASKADSRGINIKYPPAPLVGAQVDGVTDDTAAIRDIIAYAEAHGYNLYVPGVALITGELEIKKTMIIQGKGAGRGYTSAGIAGYEQVSGFLVKGTGLKRVRTRRRYRASASDPQDDPISAALNVQAENVVLRDFSLFLDFDRSDASPDNYGADWDVGIFVGCRTHFLAENVHVMGYWRMAAWYYDVTHATNLPRFLDLNGNPYDNTFNVSGGDGCTMFKCLAWGGKWGIFVAGAIKDENGGYYYDELLGALMPDYRGSFGFSDFTTYSCSIYGTDHHSFYRRNKATGNYVTDDAGGAMFIDGAAANASGSVWGSRHMSTRFASFEPYRVRLDRAARAQFYGCHIEYRSGSNRKNKDGTPVKFDATDTYGHISGTANTNHVLLIGYPGGKIDTTFMHEDVRLHNFFPSGTVTGSTTTDLIVAKGFLAERGELDLRAGDQSRVRMRQGNKSFALFDDETWRPMTDNQTSLGTSGSKFKQVYSATGAIQTSDQSKKQQIKPIDDKVLDAWSEVSYITYKFNDAVAAKGHDARMHIGVIAQEIERAFKKHGLNAFDYGLLCYEDSEYSIRPDECLMLESALMRRTTKRLEERLARLEM